MLGKGTESKCEIESIVWRVQVSLAECRSWRKKSEIIVPHSRHRTDMEPRNSECRFVGSCGKTNEHDTFGDDFSVWSFPHSSVGCESGSSISEKTPRATSARDGGAKESSGGDSHM